MVAVARPAMAAAAATYATGFMTVSMFFRSRGDRSALAMSPVEPLLQAVAAALRHNQIDDPVVQHLAHIASIADRGDAVCVLAEELGNQVPDLFVVVDNQ